MDITENLDKLDKQILGLLMKNARIPYIEIAKALEVSAGTIHGRVKKLERRNIIQGATLKINYNMVGYDFTAFVGIVIARNLASENVLSQLLNIPEVTVASVISGKYGILCKIRCKNTQQAKNIIYKINDLPEVLRTESMISLDESINDKQRLFEKIFEV